MSEVKGSMSAQEKISDLRKKNEKLKSKQKELLIITDDWFDLMEVILTILYEFRPVEWKKISEMYKEIVLRTHKIKHS